MTERSGEPVLTARVEQRVVDREGGDCLRASIASITGLADVPNVAGAAEWFEPLDAWLRLRGWSMTTHPGSKPPAGFAVGVCPSPTFAGVTHAVVVRDGEVEWDPSPRRDDPGRSYGPWKFFLRLARAASHPPVQPVPSGLDVALAKAIEGGYSDESIDPERYMRDPIYHAVVYEVRLARLAHPVEGSTESGEDR